MSSAVEKAPASTAKKADSGEKENVDVLELETIANEEKAEAEDDDAEFMPEDLAAEEERLLAERRATDAQAQANNGTGPLSEEKFEKLDTLLTQTNLYSKFLSEQINQMEQNPGTLGSGKNPDEDEEEEEAESTASGKRKAAGRKAASKKAKKAAGGKSHTQDMLPLVTGGELRQYQLRGVTWLISLFQNGLNGILADQMGLGKTVQVVGFLSHLRSKGINGPYLVVGPLSTLPNWVNEFRRWTPGVPCLLYHGTQQERAELRAQHMPISRGTIKDSFPVICTSYEIVIRDRKFLQHYQWKYLVVDEGHRLKNFDCKLIRELKCIPIANKLLLTGTPLQNNLDELWSLLHFILPDIFSSLSEFQGWFDFGNTVNEEASADLEADRRAKTVTKLHSILRPFLLRRIKADVEASMPKKKEIILYASMTAQQQEFTRATIDHSLGNLLGKLQANQVGKSTIPQINNVLMQLRKCCNHPDLITAIVEQSLEYPTPEELIEQCGKFKLFDRLMKKLKERKHKVLVFSQMTRMLDLIEHYLASQGMQPCRIDGSVGWQERQRMMDEFNNNPDIFCFLLSTRAGGLGINLVSADTCVIYDSDWNPHQDMQAMDRCHRIGQTKPVHVYRLATSHSVEGRMLKRANSKLKLEAVVIGAGQFRDKTEETSSSLSTNDLYQLLAGDVAADGLAQSGDISEDDLNLIMDRSDMIGTPTSLSGVGFETVEDKSSANLLSSVE